MTRKPLDPEYGSDGLLMLDLGSGVETLGKSGVLFAVNQFYFHGRGHELRVVDGRLKLAGPGHRVLTWQADSEVVDEAARRLRQTELDAVRFNNPGFWKANSREFDGTRADMIARARKQAGAGGQ